MNDANYLPEVLKFRQKVLMYPRLSLLAVADVEQWLREQAEKDGDSSLWLHVAVPKGATIETLSLGGCFTDPPLTIDMHNPAESVSAMLLRYTVPHDSWERSIAVSRYGVLNDLRRTSAFVAEVYGWPEALATVFILTGNQPA